MKTPIQIALSLIGNEKFCDLFEAIDYCNSVKDWRVWSQVLARTDLRDFINSLNYKEAILYAQEINCNPFWKIVCQKVGMKEYLDSMPVFEALSLLS